MKKTIVLMALCLLAVFSIACGKLTGGTGDSATAGAAPAAGISINFKAQKDATLEEKSGALYQMFEERILVIANYDLGQFKKEVETNNSAKADGQMRLRIRLTDKGAGKDAEIRTGEYKFGSPDKMVTNVTLYYFKDGKEQSEGFWGVNAEGSVKIDSVSGDTATGEIDLKGKNDQSLKGKFKAKIIKQL